MNKLLSVYRSLPWFKGKMRLGKMIFNSGINQSAPVSFTAHGGIIYNVPNTKENLGLELLINGVYEQDIVKFLKRQVPGDAVYFDIGANIGSIGLPIVKSKPGVHYFGFEASPMVFEYLEKNFKDNQILHYELYNKLVHQDDEQTMKFYQSDLYGKSSLAPTYSQEFVMVKSISMDGFCAEKNIPVIDWMKVDVQGFEIYVFEGMKRLLKEKKIKNILFEFEPWAEDQAQVAIGAAKDFIENMGYALFSLQGEPWEQHERGTDTMIWAKPKDIKIGA
ncbi:MAG: FkbM family methyltransferase [Niastella sp.]|nr:FkbM family methyltransferase [Niastella sp.]